MKKILYILFIFTGFLYANQRAMTVEDMWAMKRIGQAVLSPDGEWVAFEMTEYKMDDNSRNTDIWMVSTKDGTVRQMTVNSAYDGTPRWKPDGSELSFISDRNGSAQIFSMPLNGGEACQLSFFPVDVDNFIWSPDGKQWAFAATVFADAPSLEASAARDREKQESLVKARVIDRLMFRQWNRWTNGKYSHIYVSDVQGNNVRDVTPGEYDAPPLDLGGDQDFMFSPDGKELAFVSNHDSMIAISTNNDVFLYSLNNQQTTCITVPNKSVDNQPVYSPDGRFLVYNAMKRPGFESDQNEIILFDRKAGEKTSLTENFDRNPQQVIWSPDSKKLYFCAENRGRKSLYELEVKSKTTKEILFQHSNSNLMMGPNKNCLYFKQQSVSAPNEIYKLDLSTGKYTQLTFINQSLLKELAFNNVEDFEYKSFDNQMVHGFMLKPPFFDKNKKYPVVLLIHGGPQNMWCDNFHFRWNASMFASPGYVVVMINIRGSKGYGQEWCDAVSKDWGGGPYKDLMSGLDYVCQNFSFIEGKKIVAAGASYGGFMINWIATHTDRFKALACHAGVYDQVSMYGSTEELWFPEWEFDGNPYENPDLYRKWSPSTYAANLKKYNVPTLVTHGQNDFRVPVSQAFQFFTALQRQNVPSRLVYFPDEYHFVTKPQNAQLWWNEIFNWFEKWIN